MKVSLSTLLATLKQRHYIRILILIIALLIAIGLFYLLRSRNASTLSTVGVVQPDAILISDSGSTNTPAYTITVNPNGSGLDSRSGKTLPAGVLDYAGLKSDIVALPSMHFKASCMKSVSFGTSESVTFKGETSSDISCPPNDQVSALYNKVVDVTTGASCYQSSSIDCQIYHNEHAHGLDSGVQGSVSVVPIPHCTPPFGVKPGESDPCWGQAMTAKFNITKPDGSLVTSISTDSQGGFYAALAPGTYELVDLSAGSSLEPHQFYDSNANGNYQHWATTYTFTVPPHQYLEVDPWFDGTTF